MGNIDYSLIRYLQFCVFQWLPEQQIYTKTLVDVSNDSDVSYGTRRSIRFQQINPIIWPSDSKTQYVIPIFGMNSNSSGEFLKRLWLTSNKWKYCCGFKIMQKVQL